MARRPGPISRKRDVEQKTGNPGSGYDEQVRAHKRRPSAAELNGSGELKISVCLTNLQDLTYATENINKTDSFVDLLSCDPGRMVFDDRGLSVLSVGGVPLCHAGLRFFLEVRGPRR